MRRKLLPRVVTAALTVAVFSIAASAAAGGPAGSLQAGGATAAPTVSFVPSFVAAGLSTPVVRTMEGTLTPPLRDLPSAPPIPTPPFYEHREGVTAVSEGPNSAIPDPAIQSSPGSGDMPSPIATYDGLGQADRAALGLGGGLPPDVEGDVGPDHYVEWINVLYAVYSKSGVLAATFPKLGNTIWTALPGTTELCETTNRGDPLVTYDQFADRWVLSQFAFNVGGTGAPIPPYYQCMAVSTTGDPTGSYCLYTGLVDSTYSSGEVFNDYGKIGVWPDAYYLSYAGFPDGGTGGSQFTPAAMAFERSKMITAGCPAAQSVYFDEFNNAAILGSAQNRMLPSDVDGPTLPPTGEPNPYVMHDDAGNEVEVYEFAVDWTTPASSTFTSVANLAVTAFDTAFSCGTSGRQCIPQPSPETNRLDALATRLMYELNYRNFGTHQSLVVNQTVDATGTDQAGVRWYELRSPHAVPTVHQQSTYAPDANHRWMGSAAMDNDGNLAVGYSISNGLAVGGGAVFPSIRYAGRLATDPLSVLTQGEATLFTGSGTQTGVGYSLSGAARWGDYTRMTVDPSDDCTFWYVNEYYPATGNDDYDTRFGKFKFAECAPPTAAKVTRFEARWRGPAVVVSWRTADEVDTLGFNVYRSAGSGSFRKLNRTLVAAKRAGQTGSAVYRFVDRRVKRSAAYTYRLQTVASDGKQGWYGVGSAAAG